MPPVGPEKVLAGLGWPIGKIDRHGVNGAAFRLHRRRPICPRIYQTWGWPVLSNPNPTLDRVIGCPVSAMPSLLHSTLTRTMIRISRPIPESRRPADNPLDRPEVCQPAELGSAETCRVSVHASDLQPQQNTMGFDGRRSVAAFPGRHVPRVT